MKTSENIDKIIMNLFGSDLNLQRRDYKSDSICLNITISNVWSYIYYLFRIIL
jgi:hypothetical protein